MSAYQPLNANPLRKCRDIAETLRTAGKTAEARCCIGADVGGSDIKIAANVHGKLIYLSEHNWNPAGSTSAEGVIDPILCVVREAKEAIEKAGNSVDAIGLSFPDAVIEDMIVGGETPKTKGIRFLFGRFVKSPRCFTLLQEGFGEIVNDIRLEAADDAISNTSLMKQLSAMPDKTVAQFGQAIGAIYYAQM